MWRWRRRPSSARCRPGVLTFTFKQLIESSSGLTTLVTSSTVNNGTSNNKNTSRSIDVDGCVARVAFFLGIYLPVIRNSNSYSFLLPAAAALSAVQDLQQVSYGFGKKKHLVLFCSNFCIICSSSRCCSPPDFWSNQQQVKELAKSFHIWPILYIDLSNSHSAARVQPRKELHS